MIRLIRFTLGLGLLGVLGGVNPVVAQTAAPRSSQPVPPPAPFHTTA